MPAFAFRKSSHSDPERECVEVATNVPNAVAVRDSKDPEGRILRFTPAAWADFRSVLAASAGSSSRECGVGPGRTPIPSS
ncbi:DUF397 domain-containing protein [Streptomyces sp. SID8361]|uniref:DUF397 domain-containing protein n=1 Tax=Streptomyces sp. MnatMP-M27 TaxID=1839768 RepID=UPI00081F1BD8|nr:DUF397 domain-containing protein [Streptomyces sp. MnatMP-M27]MYU13986.1 DUF397 domain-containing protein [Streptomyces sp. SID8361]SCG03681.1 protein of unknown function [Streptomyces sp. MnatMP-M27]